MAASLQRAFPGGDDILRSNRRGGQATRHLGASDIARYQRCQLGTARNAWLVRGDWGRRKRVVDAYRVVGD
jgi:hypothetical protein